MTLKMVPYLIMNGNAKEAVDFYQKALSAEMIGIQTFAEMPANPDFPLPEEARDRVSHAMLKVGETEMMFSDTLPGDSHQIGSNVNICIMSKDAARSKEIFAALQEGGQVEMPIQETFWSPAYGIITDKFGIRFQISTDSGE